MAVTQSDTETRLGDGSRLGDGTRLGVPFVSDTVYPALAPATVDSIAQTSTTFSGERVYPALAPMGAGTAGVTSTASATSQPALASAPIEGAATQTFGSTTLEPAIATAALGDTSFSTVLGEGVRLGDGTRLGEGRIVTSTARARSAPEQASMAVDTDPVATIHRLRPVPAIAPMVLEADGVTSTTIAVRDVIAAENPLEATLAFDNPTSGTYALDHPIEVSVSIREHATRLNGWADVDDPDTSN